MSNLKRPMGIGIRYKRAIVADAVKIIRDVYMGLRCSAG